MGISNFGLFSLGGGLLNSYLSTKASMIRFEQKKQEISKKKNTEKPEQTQKERERESMMRMLAQNMESTQESNKINQLAGKLKAGMLLTSDELAYLRTKNPELYKTAMEVKCEREKYKKELEKCRTKEEVERVRANKMQQFVSEVKAVQGNSNIPEGKKLEIMQKIQMRMTNIMNEHTSFVKSPRYASLPTEQELREEKERREKKAGEVSDDDEILHLPQKEEQPKTGESEETWEDSGTVETADQEALTKEGSAQGDNISGGSDTKADLPGKAAGSSRSHHATGSSGSRRISAAVPAAGSSYPTGASAPAPSINIKA